LVEAPTQTELCRVCTTQRLSCHPVENDGENGDDGEYRKRDPTGPNFPVLKASIGSACSTSSSAARLSPVQRSSRDVRTLESLSTIGKDLRV